jgi:hypothetical protein
LRLWAGKVWVALFTARAMSRGTGRWVLGGYRILAVACWGLDRVACTRR